MIDTNFDIKRFSLSEGTLDGYKGIRNFVDERTQTDPRFVGLTFIGSRLHALEHDQSDFDTIVFFDASDFQFNHTRDVQVQNRILEQRKQYMIHLRNDVGEMMKRAKLPVDDELGKSIHPLDTSIDIRSFRSEVSRLFGAEPVDAMKLQIDDSYAGFPLASSFFLGLGERLINHRSNVLDTFENEPDGEKLFQDLMQYLQYYERRSKTSKRFNLPLYMSYPKTISEARQFFVTKPTLRN